MGCARKFEVVTERHSRSILITFWIDFSLLYKEYLFSVKLSFDCESFQIFKHFYISIDVRKPNYFLIVNFEYYINVKYKLMLIFLSAKLSNFVRKFLYFYGK